MQSSNGTKILIVYALETLEMTARCYARQGKRKKQLHQHNPGSMQAPAPGNRPLRGCSNKRMSWVLSKGTWSKMQHATQISTHRPLKDGPAHSSAKHAHNPPSDVHGSLWSQ
eukprot:1138089-Pelagomonas_calceolata.AAC.12